MKVFLVIEGEKYEASRILGCYSTWKKAHKIASARAKKLDLDYVQGAPGNWEDGVDYVYISERTLDE